VTASILPGALDSLGNANAASTSTDNTVAFTGVPIASKMKFLIPTIYIIRILFLYL
jgi:hypothetical protein